MLNSAIKDAIKAAVEDAGQPEELANALIAWMEAVVSGNEDLSDPDSTNYHIDLLFAKTHIEEEQL